MVTKLFYRPILWAWALVAILALPPSALAHWHDNPHGNHGWHRGWSNHQDGWRGQWHPGWQGQGGWPTRPPVAWNNPPHRWRNYPTAWQNWQNPPCPAPMASSYFAPGYNQTPGYDETPGFYGNRAEIMRNRNAAALEINQLRARGDSRGAARLAGVMQNLNAQLGQNSRRYSGTAVPTANYTQPYYGNPNNYGGDPSIGLLSMLGAMPAVR